MNRRSFLTRSALVLPALLVGDKALEAFARLTHVRKTFPSAPVQLTAAEQMEKMATEHSSMFFYGMHPLTATDILVRRDEARPWMTQWRYA